MKRVITIILSLSLLVPHAAKMLAYVDCSFVMLSNSDPNFCDCNMIVTADMIPSTPDMPDRQKELELKADWKYVPAESFLFSGFTAEPVSQLYNTTNNWLPQQSLRAVFHPPRC